MSVALEAIQAEVEAVVSLNTTTHKLVALPPTQCRVVLTSAGPPTAE